MTFEEKIKEIQHEGVVKSVRYWDDRHKNLTPETSKNFSRYMTPCFSNLALSIAQGDVNVKEEVEQLKKTIPLLKKALKFYNQYKGCKSVIAYSDFVLKFDNHGILVLLDVITPENLLYWSRMLRDAEKRALKHPRHK